MSPLSKNLRWIGIGLMGLYGVYFLVTGILQLAGGDSSWASRLVAALIVAAMVFVAWRRPAVVGLLFLGIGLVVVIYNTAIFVDRSTANAWILAGLPLLVGVLLLAAGLVQKPAR
jgi:hypothetical protein